MGVSGPKKEMVGVVYAIATCNGPESLVMNNLTDFTTTKNCFNEYIPAILNILSLCFNWR